MSIISVVLLVLFGILIGYAIWYKVTKVKSKSTGVSSSRNQSTKPVKKRRK